MADFPQTHPPKEVTDPDGIGANVEFPLHMHKLVTPEDPAEPGENVLVVAWNKREPIFNHFEVVGTAEMDEAAFEAAEAHIAELKAKGYTHRPQLGDYKPKAATLPARPSAARVDAPAETQGAKSDVAELKAQVAQLTTLVGSLVQAQQAGKPAAKKKDKSKPAGAGDAGEGDGAGSEQK